MGMTREACKEMDRRCVMNWLSKVYATPSRAFSEHTDEELKMFAYDALVLLNEQQPKKAKWKAVHYIRKEGTKTFKKCTCCGYTCNGWDIETGIAYDYCPNCGAEMQNGNTNRDSK